MYHRKGRDCGNGSGNKTKACCSFLIYVFFIFKMGFLGVEKGANFERENFKARNVIRYKEEH